MSFNAIDLDTSKPSVKVHSRVRRNLRNLKSISKNMVKWERKKQNKTKMTISKIMCPLINTEQIMKCVTWLVT